VEPSYLLVERSLHNILFKELMMKRILLVLVVVVVMTFGITTSALASGDKVRGENGEGSVVQVQVQDPPPFQP
jgi:hypothetical protein